MQHKLKFLFLLAGLCGTVLLLTAFLYRKEPVVQSGMPLQGLTPLTTERIVFTAKVDGDPVTVKFASQREGEEAVMEEITIPPKDIFIMPPAGGNPRRLTYFRNDIGSAHICPRGQRVVFSMSWRGNTQIFIVDVDGTNYRQLTDSKAHNEAPRFSPDGNTIVFQSDRDGIWQIYTMKTDGSEQTKLIDNQQESNGPVFHPRLPEVLYTVWAPGKKEQLYLYNIAQKKSRQLTRGQRSCHGARFSHDGQYIVYRGMENKKRHLWRLHLKTGKEECLTEKLPFQKPLYAHPAFNPHNNDEIIFINYDGIMPPNLYRMKIGAPKRLQNLSQDHFYPMTADWWRNPQF